MPVGHPVGAGKYAGLFGSIYGGFPMADKPPIPGPPGNGPLGVDIPKSLLFQNMTMPPTSTPTPPSPTPSPGALSSAMGHQNSASLPHWATNEALHQHRFDGATTANSRPESPRLPAPRGEGLAA